MLRPSKRARGSEEPATVEEPAAPAAAAHAVEEPTSIAHLPVELLARVLSFLPFENAWPLRRVSKLWRSALERAEFEIVRLSGLTYTQRSNSIWYLNAFSRAARSSGIARCVPTAYIDMEPSFPCMEDWVNEDEPEDPDTVGGNDAARARMGLFQLFGAVCRVLAAITPSAEIVAGSSAERRLSRPSAPQPRRRSVEVVLDLSFTPYAYLDEYFKPADNLARSLVLGVLAALRPVRTASSPAASDPERQPVAPSVLEELTVEVKWIEFAAWRPWTPDAGDLRTFLAPFSNLRALELAANSCTITGPAAAAIAECCPRLTKLEMWPGAAEAVGALAALPLEHVIIRTSRQTPFAGGIAQLAAGPASRTLQIIQLFHQDEHKTAGAGELSSDDLRALPRFVNLERLLDVLLVPGRATQEDVACLGAVPKLSILILSVLPNGDDAGTAALRGLSEAFRASRSLTDVDLEITLPNPDAAAVADVVRAAGAALRKLAVRLAGRPITAAELEALVACSPRAEVSVSCEAATLADVLPFQVLARAPAALAPPSPSAPRWRRLCSSAGGLRVTVAVRDDGVREVASGLVAAWLPPSSRASVLFSKPWPQPRAP
eukprot:tig00001042_g6605.t1